MECRDRECWPCALAVAFLSRLQSAISALSTVDALSSWRFVGITVSPAQVLAKVTSAKAHYRRAQALLGQGRCELADTAAREALRLEPGDSSLRALQGRIRGLRQTAAICIRATPVDRPPSIGCPENLADDASKEVSPELIECGGELSRMEWDAIQTAAS